MTSEELETKILTNIFLGDLNNEWIQSKTEDLSNMAECIIEVFPKDAKTIDEVKSFIVEEGVMGSIFYKFKRKSKE